MKYRHELTNQEWNRITFALGVFAGIALCGPAAQAATTAITAALSSHTIYVDGVQVSMTAYAINGNNYVKLRDIGEAVDFNVYWDGKAVQIESDRPYTGEAPANQTSQPVTESQGVGDGYLANGKPVTEENVLELLRQIEGRAMKRGPFLCTNSEKQEESS